MRTGKIIALCLTATASLTALSRCVNKKVADPRGNEYAGAAICTSCHPALTGSFAHTAHYLSTRVASNQTVHGLFTPASGRIDLGDHRRLAMEKNQDGFFQVSYQDSVRTHRARLDLVMGAVKGESYLSRTKEGYVELPASWLTGIRRWTLSPGFSNADVSFSRPASRGCFECHSAWMPGPSSLPSDADPVAEAVLNIDCERCHGPAAAHVSFHQENPQVKQATAIVRISQLNRQQKMDLCATCHSGTKKTRLKTTFGFRPGDSLRAFVIPDFMGSLPVDVHGNQSQALSASRCYNDGRLDCNSCHNSHVSNSENKTSVNLRCQTCHQSEDTHKDKLMATVSPHFLQQHCTGCHMPSQASTSIRLQPGADSAAIAVHIVNHRIAVYPDATTEILKTNKP